MTVRAEWTGRRYDTVFFDVDGTLLWVDLDVEGYVEDLAPYSHAGELTVEPEATFVVPDLAGLLPPLLEG